MPRDPLIAIRVPEDLKQRLEAEQARIKEENPEFQISLSGTVRMLVKEALDSRDEKRLREQGAD